MNDKSPSQFRKLEGELLGEKEASPLVGKSIPGNPPVRSDVEHSVADHDLFHVMMEHTQTSVVQLDLDFNFVEVNSACVAFSGRSRDQLLGNNFFDIVPR